jgi:hypothetical protein
MPKENYGTWRGLDGKAYQMKNGKPVEVSQSYLMVQSKPLPSITVDGITINRDRNGKITLSENGKLIATTQAEIQKVNVERFGGQMDAKVTEEYDRMQQSGQMQPYLYIGGGLLLLILLLKSR